MKVAFFGSPGFAVPILNALVENFEVVLVSAQPSKPAGRGLKLTLPPVAARAVELGLPLAQPKKLRDNGSFVSLLLDSGAEVGVTCAYGKILPVSLLSSVKHGFLNVHTSLLPKYRGAAPIQWALINGEERSGVTVMQTDVGLDTGAVLLQESVDILPDETALELAPRLAKLGASLIISAVKQVDSLPRLTQDDSLASVARLLDKVDGRVRWVDSTRVVYNRFRGVAGWPGSYCFYGGKTLKIHDMRPADFGGSIGEIIGFDDGVIVGTADSSVRLIEVQPEGKARMSSMDWVRGYQVKSGDRLE